jgi:hypothetical protein
LTTARGASELGRGEDAAGGIDHQEEGRPLDAGRDRGDRRGVFALREDEARGPENPSAAPRMD